MKIQLTQELGQKILTYLCNRPYAEVYEMIDEMKQVEVVIEANKEEEKTPDAPKTDAPDLGPEEHVEQPVVAAGEPVPTTEDKGVEPPQA